MSGTVREPSVELTTAARLLLAASLGLVVLSAAGGVVTGDGLLRGVIGDRPGREIALGWVSLGVLGGAAALFGAGAGRRLWLAWFPIAAVTLHEAASWFAGDAARTATAAVALAAVVAFLLALASRVRAVPIAVTHAGMLLALVILAAGLLFEVVAEVNRVGAADWVPFRAAGARSPSLSLMAVVAGTAVAEWRLIGHRPAVTATWGLAQTLLFAVGWAALLVGTAADSLDLLVGSAALHGVAVAIFLGRVAPGLPGAPARGRRCSGATVLFLAVHMGLLAHVGWGIARRDYLELAQVPGWLTFAVDQVVFAGVVLNLLVGLAAPWSRMAFWAVNLGVTASILGRVAGAGAVDRLATAVISIGVAAGLATLLRSGAADHQAASAVMTTDAGG